MALKQGVSPTGGRALSSRPYPAPARSLILLGGALFFTLITPVLAAAEDLPAEFDLRTTLQSKTGHGVGRIAFNTQGAHGYVLAVEPAKVLLLRRNGKTETLLAQHPGFGLEDARQAGVKVTIQRRKGRIFVLAGSRLLMSVEDNNFNEGTAGLTTAGGASATELQTQPVEALYFSDDFMRQPTEPGEWSYDKGYWGIETIGIVQRSANPFSLRSRPDPVAIATTGYSFWTDYVFEAAAKGSATTSFGICTDVQDPQNYYRLRWSAGAKGALELQRVAGGKATTLAQVPGGFIPDRWYQLGLRTSAGHLIAEVDHQPVLTVRDSTYGAGKIGLYSEGSNGNIVYFDSILVHPAHWLFDDFAAGNPHTWEVDGQKAVGGSPDWQNYTVSAQVIGSQKLAAIPLHYRDSRNYYAFAWQPGHSELVAMVNGQRRVLASSDRGASVGRTHAVQAGVEDGYLWGAIDGAKVVEGADFSIPAGRAGFQPASASTRVVRALNIRLAESPEPTDALTAEFTDVGHHPEMQGWAGPLNAWEDASFGKDSGYWHKGNLFGDLTCKVPLIPRDLQDGSFSVLLNGDGQDAHSGYEVSYIAKDGKTISLALLRQGKTVATGTVPVPVGQDQVSLDVYRRGSWIFARIGDKTPVRYHDAEPVDGYSLLRPAGYAGNAGGHSRLGLIVRGDTPLDIPSINVLSRHVYAETFHLAPVNWRPQGGTWEVTRRWSCQPGWTWYGGKGDGYAANWYKASLWGDQSIDYYTAAMMSATETSGRESWRDLNCSFCSDGTNLFSGYTLMVGGWDNTTTRLFRKGKMVAENSEFHFPPMGVAHRLWYDIHITREAGKIGITTTYIDTSGRKQTVPLVEWTDPDPLPGGYVGYWTYDNGMLLARTVLCYQQKGPEPLYTAQPVWTSTLPDDAAYPNPKLPKVGLADLPVPPSSRPGASTEALIPGAMAAVPHHTGGMH